MLFSGTEQAIRVLVGIKRNGFAISNLASCNTVGWLRRKAFAAGNLMTVIKEQGHERHRFDLLDDDDVKYHGLDPPVGDPPFEGRTTFWRGLLNYGGEHCAKVFEGERESLIVPWACPCQEPSMSAGPTKSTEKQ